MGTLYEHKSAQVRELRETYHGVLMLLRHFISKDKYTENHSYRVSVYAARIAARLDLGPERIEDVRAAALLHDIGKLEISRELLYKAARLTKDEFEEVQRHVDKGVGLLESVGGSLRRVLPIILAHHDKFDGTGYHPLRGEEIPIEARIISVADVYDALTSDRPLSQGDVAVRRQGDPGEGRGAPTSTRWWSARSWTRCTKARWRCRPSSCEPAPCASLQLTVHSSELQLTVSRPLEL